MLPIFHQLTFSFLNNNNTDIKFAVAAVESRHAETGVVALETVLTHSSVDAR